MSVLLRTEEAARTYPGRNLITRAVGTEPAVLSDVFFVETGEDGEYILLCSDGLSNLLSAQELLAEVQRDHDRSDCCERLVRIAKERGAPDNVTVVLVSLN